VTKCRRRLGDRYDGRLLRTVDPFFKIVPYIMKERVDAQNFFDEKIYISETEAYIRTKRNEGLEGLSFFHIIIAAMVRLLSQKPGLNRFIAGQKIYARNDILISFAVKKDMSEEGLETTIKLKFNPEDTLKDIVEKVNMAIKANKGNAAENDTDKTAKIVMSLPRFIIKLFIWFLRTLDYYGLMPKILNNISPFHTSVFITDLGSLGIQPVYHHLYEFGTTSIFLAFGPKQKERVIDSNNNIVEKRYVSLRAVTDERIVDGFYYAGSFRLLRKLIQFPVNLEYPPEIVVEDVE
jgi:chloramphenicol O-acetyltransferase